MVELTAEQLAQRVFELNLLDAREVEGVWSAFGTREVSSDDFLSLLVRRELLTNYQVDRLRRGEKAGYFYGDYKVLYLVGTGSFARVYRAVHQETGKVVAVKVLRKRFCDDPVQKDQFLREGEMGRSLRHPNIVPIFEVHAKGRLHFLVMDFVEGRNLREFVKIRKRLTPLEATRVITDIASGLAYAAERGITHRDLKLSNVLMSSTGRAQLVDFGLAGVDEDMSDEALNEHPNPRTIDYAALERATGVRKDDPRSDIYFVGAMFYHLLTGQAPFSDTKDRLQRLSVSRFEKIAPIEKIVSDVPTSVVKIVRKSMEMKPEKRYQTPAEMVVELKAATQRLSINSTHEAPDKEGSSVSPAKGRADGSLEGLSRSVMIVESNPSMQDMFRDRLKKHGYRVLVISDAGRALDRLDSTPCPADCVVFSARGLGRLALDAYNELLNRESTKSLPSILLLDRKQKDWSERANLSAHRRALLMPLKFGEFRQALNRLFEVSEANDQPTG